MEKQNSGFGSIFGFLMTMIGFAVGVGSLWRFPYICGTNGGALFIITYVLVILLVGIPLLTAEMSMGYCSQHKAVGAYRALEKPGMSVVLTVASLGTRVALAYLLSAIPAVGVVGIWWSVPIGWFLADAIGLLYFQFRKARLLPWAE